MNAAPAIGAVIILACGLGGAHAQVAALSCSTALPDCLLGEAAAAAETVARPGLRDEVRFSIAVALADMDRLDEALEVAAEIVDPWTLADAQGEIAKAAARAGEYSRAYVIAVTIVDPRVRSARIAAFESLAIQQAAAGEIDAAFDTVVAIANPYRRSEAQAAIATSVARAGDIPGSIRAAARIGTNYWFTPDQHELKIASGLVPRAGEFDHFWFYQALVNIAQIQAQSGDVLGALQTAKSIPDFAGRSRAASRIAGVQADAGDPDGALTTAARVETPYGDLEALVAIARAKARAGDFAGALDLASEVATAYGDGGGLMAVAIEQAGQGLLDDSLETVSQIDNLDTLTQALAGITRALASNARIDDALEVAVMIQAEDRPAAIREIAVRLAEAGDPVRALEVAAEFAGRRNHDEVVVAVAVAQAQSGDLDGAVATALGLEDTVYRAIALASIAPFAGQGALASQ